MLIEYNNKEFYTAKDLAFSVIGGDENYYYLPSPKYLLGNHYTLPLTLFNFIAPKLLSLYTSLFYPYLNIINIFVLKYFIFILV